MKLVVSYLKKQALLLVTYLDRRHDTICLLYITKSYNSCLRITSTTVDLLKILGIAINTEKSNLITKQAQFLVLK